MRNHSAENSPANLSPLRIPPDVAGRTFVAMMQKSTLAKGNNRLFTKIFFAQFSLAGRSAFSVRF
jgi:hypothetical protein